MKSLGELFEISHGAHSQIRSMEGLRGLAVFMVFMVHYVTLIEPWLAGGTMTSSVAASLRGLCNAGVDLFFVLSGYLIYGTLMAKPRSLLPYFRRRVQRIYPVFMAVFAIYLALSWLFPQESKIPSAGLKAAAYIAANLLLLPGLLPIEPVITVAWSLSYEMFYYLLIPAVIAVFRLRAWSSSMRMGAFLGVAILGFAWASWGGASHVRLLMFVSGILLFEAVQFRDLPRIDLLGLMAFVAGLVAVDQWATGLTRFVVLFGSFFALCYACFRANGLASRVFCWTPLRWLGNMSYSYYLIHGLALKAGFILLSKAVPQSAAWGANGFCGLLAPMFAGTLIPAVLLFAWVEKPLSLTRKRTSSYQIPGDASAPN